MLLMFPSHNDSLLNPSAVENQDIFYCLATNPEKTVFKASNVTHVILLLPLCVLILRSGFQQLQQRNLGSSAAVSHCDAFTYHMVVMELVGMSGLVLFFSASCLENVELFSAGFVIFSCSWYGQTFFHILTCVERYLAVVHPVWYRCLRSERGIRVRNIGIGCIWMICFAGSGGVGAGQYVYLDSSLLMLSTVIISFCSVSVLCVLVRPGPGGRGRERADQTKQKAFYTILLILGVLMFRLSFGLVWVFFYISGHAATCMLLSCGIFINVPSSLVLPLLFLQRRGKLRCSKST